MALPDIKQCISDYLHAQAVQTPDREAVVYGNQRISYAELSVRVNQCAKALLAHGIEKGDRVAVLSTSRLEFWITFLAATQIGAIWMGLNAKYRLQELQYVVDDAEPVLLFTLAGFEQEHYGDTIAALRSASKSVSTVITLTDSLPHSQTYTEFLSAGDVVSDQALDERHSTVEAMDPALLVYTSGSSGKPKGALLSHYGVCFGSTVANHHFDISLPRVLCYYPVNHVSSVVDTCCVNLVAGGTVIFQERFLPQQVLQTVSEERLNILGGVPTMLLALLEHPSFAETDFSSLELIAWGGAAMPVETIKRLQQIAPRLLNMYGMTETAANTTYTDPNADLIELSETVGRPSPYFPCRIVNSEGNPCEVNEQGELQFQGDHLLLAYLNRPEATQAVYTEDGWLHTGDIGYWRDNGAITLVGRLSEMFKSGGYNVYPREIEEVLESHPDIVMAAVVSIPDARYQEVGAAFIQVAPQSNVTQVALKDFCKTRLANYKVPKCFALLEELPLLPVGKVDKARLKKITIDQKDFT